MRSISPSEVSAIAKGRYQAPVRDTGKRLRVNDLIRISPIFLISEDNEKVGAIELDKAKQLAREAGLDLVEVSPNSRPPVCRIMDYGKWKYQQKKKEQKARSHSKQSELKEVRLRPKIDTHDLEIKTTRAREFLADGDKVQFTVLFRGREMAHQDIGLATLRTIRDALVDASKVEAEPRTMGKRMTMILAPDRKSTKPGGDHKPPSGSAAPSGSPAPGGAAPAAASAAGGLGPVGPRVVAPRPAPAPAAAPATAPAAASPAAATPAPAAPAPAPTTK